jgi:hypothetical protein
MLFFHGINKARTMASAMKNLSEEIDFRNRSKPLSSLMDVVFLISFSGPDRTLFPGHCHHAEKRSVSGFAGSAS